MRGWISKFIFLLIVYFAGFATAIYTLAPAPPRSSTGTGKRITRIEANDVANSFNAGMHKCVDFGKEAAWRTAKFIKQKLKEMREA